ncbi:MAG: hypothetical protein FWH14_07310 [Oscillospiraceae bacterium]|nr:hypothetical protein [Oscillospiraceae bacterium]
MQAPSLFGKEGALARAGVFPLVPPQRRGGRLVGAAICRPWLLRIVGMTALGHPWLSRIVRYAPPCVPSLTNIS